MYMAPKTPPVMTGATTTYETNDIHLDGVAMAAWNDGQIDHVLAHNPADSTHYALRIVLSDLLDSWSFSASLHFCS